MPFFMSTIFEKRSLGLALYVEYIDNPYIEQDLILLTREMPEGKVINSIELEGPQWERLEQYVKDLVEFNKKKHAQNQTKT